MHNAALINVQCYYQKKIEWGIWSLSYAMFAGWSSNSSTLDFPSELCKEGLGCCSDYEANLPVGFVGGGGAGLFLLKLGNILLGRIRFHLCLFLVISQRLRQLTPISKSAVVTYSRTCNVTGCKRHEFSQSHLMHTQHLFLTLQTKKDAADSTGFMMRREVKYVL